MQYYLDSEAYIDNVIYIHYNVNINLIYVHVMF
jgi:hypothetical protein